jgi:hypothetical protein
VDTCRRGETVIEYDYRICNKQIGTEVYDDFTRQLLIGIAPPGSPGIIPDLGRSQIYLDPNDTVE